MFLRFQLKSTFTQRNDAKLNTGHLAKMFQRHQIFRMTLPENPLENSWSIIQRDGYENEKQFSSNVYLWELRKTVFVKKHLVFTRLIKVIEFQDVYINT